MVFGNRSLVDNAAVAMASMSMNSDYKETNVAIVKATDHTEGAPKEKHVQSIVAACGGPGPPPAGMEAGPVYVAKELAKRAAESDSYVVACKALVCLHRIALECPKRANKAVHDVGAKNNYGLTHFKDETSPNTIELSGWVRTYAAYVEERTAVTDDLAFDMHQDGEAAIAKCRDMPPKDVLKYLASVQRLISRLVALTPEGPDVQKCTTAGSALKLALQESRSILCCANVLVMNLVDRFFEMSRSDAKEGLQLYKAHCRQLEAVTRLYDRAKLNLTTNDLNLPDFEQPPKSFLSSLEEYVANAPRSTDGVTPPGSTNNGSPAMGGAILDVGTAASPAGAAAGFGFSASPAAAQPARLSTEAALAELMVPSPVATSAATTSVAADPFSASDGFGATPEVSSSAPKVKAMAPGMPAVNPAAPHPTQLLQQMQVGGVQSTGALPEAVFANSPSPQGMMGGARPMAAPPMMGGMAPMQQPMMQPMMGGVPGMQQPGMGAMGGMPPPANASNPFAQQSSFGGAVGAPNQPPAGTVLVRRDSDFIKW